MIRDLKKCKIDQEWMSIAQNRDEWASIVEVAANEVNERAEEMEKMQRNMRKERRERKQVVEQTDLQCIVPGCSFVAHNKAALVNHCRQRHRAAAAQETLTYQNCHRHFKSQGFHNHIKFCQQNSTRTKRTHRGSKPPAS